MKQNPPCQPPPCHQPPPCRPQPPAHCGWPVGNRDHRTPYQFPSYPWWNTGRVWQSATGSGNQTAR